MGYKCVFQGGKIPTFKAMGDKKGMYQAKNFSVPRRCSGDKG
jgi:hypothetical protein